VSRKTRKKQMGKTVVRPSWPKKILPYVIAVSAFSVCLLVGLWFLAGRSPEWFDKSRSLFDPIQNADIKVSFSRKLECPKMVLNSKM
jgi:hypothetical protein